MYLNSDCQSIWEEIRRLSKNAFKSSFHFSIATSDENGNPHITPIGSLILRKDFTGFFLDPNADFIRYNGTAWVDSTIQNSDISQGAVTQHQAALSITESQISDLQSYLTAETNDLSAAVVWANVPNANITQGSVTQHQAALSIATTQLTGTISNAQLAGSITNAKLVNSSVTIGSDTVSLGGTQTDLNGITSLDVDNITVDGNFYLQDKKIEQTTRQIITSIVQQTPVPVIE